MAQSIPLNPVVILIVEDEALVRLELAHQLEEMGYHVLAAEDADEAIVLLDGHPEIELLLTDLTMPGLMDGTRLAHHVRNRWPPVKITVMSGRIGTAIATLPGGTIFLPKPYAPKALFRALAEHAHVGRSPAWAG